MPKYMPCHRPCKAFGLFWVHIRNISSALEGCRQGAHPKPQKTVRLTSWAACTSDERRTNYKHHSYLTLPGYHPGDQSTYQPAKIMLLCFAMAFPHFLEKIFGSAHRTSTAVKCIKVTADAPKTIGGLTMRINFIGERVVAKVTVRTTKASFKNMHKLFATSIACYKAGQTSAMYLCADLCAQVRHMRNSSSFPNQVFL